MYEDLKDIFHMMWQEALYTCVFRYHMEPEVMKADEVDRQVAVAKWDETVSQIIALLDTKGVSPPQMELWLSYSPQYRKPTKPKKKKEYIRQLPIPGLIYPLAKNNKKIRDVFKENNGNPV